VTQQATESSFYDEIGGQEAIDRIVTRFYEGVATDPVLGPMYPAEDLANGAAAWRLSAFLAQYWGGPTTYSEQRGHPRLRMRHAPFRVNQEAREHWLTHFRAGLDEARLTPEQDAKFWGYVTYAAEFMLNSE
jgi:hemoglobin